MVKIEGFHGKFYRYIDRHMKTIRNNWKKARGAFSDKTDDFHVTCTNKLGKYIRKMLKLKIFFENFTDPLVDIGIILEINGIKKWRPFLIKLKFFI